MAGAWTRVVGLLSAGSKITASGWVLGVKNAVDDLQGSWAGAFANAAARDAALTSPANGTTCYLLDVDKLVTRRAGAWVPVVVGDSTWADLAVGTASLRTIGTGALQAAAGTHTHGAGASVSTQSFTASGTWTSPAGVSAALVLLVGGGSSSNGEHGGGGGDVKYQWVPVSPSTGYTVTIGAGGTGGSNGGASSFGALLSAAGGLISSGTSGSGNPGGVIAFSSAGGSIGRGGGGAGGPGGPAFMSLANSSFVNSSYVAYVGGNGGPGRMGYGGGGAGACGGSYPYNGRGADGGGDTFTAGAANRGGGGGGSTSGNYAGGSGFCQVWWFA